MKTILIGSLALVLLSAGMAAPSRALPGGSGFELLSGGSQHRLLLARHHRHYGHWRYWRQRSSRYPVPEPVPQASAPGMAIIPAHPAPESGSAQPHPPPAAASSNDAAAPGNRAAGPSAPSIHWVDPDTAAR